MLAHAYELTKAPKYAVYCRAFLRDYIADRIRAAIHTSDGLQSVFSSMSWGSEVPAMFAGAMQGIEEIGEARLDEIEKQIASKPTSDEEANKNIRSEMRQLPPTRITGFD